MVWDEEVRASRDWLIALVVLLGLALALMFTIGDLRSR